MIKNKKTTILIVIGSLILATVIAVALRQATDKSSSLASMAVMGNKDSSESLIVGLDSDGKVLGSYRTSSYISTAYFGKDELWYSFDDGLNYQVLSLKDFTTVRSVNSINGDIMYSCPAGRLVNKDDSTSYLYINATQRIISFDTEVYDAYDDGTWLYVLTGDDMIGVYQLSDLQAVSSYSVIDDGYMVLTVVGDKVYYVTQTGYTLLGKEHLDTTYLYPVKFDSIAYANGKYLGLLTGETVTNYVVTFDQYQMVLTPDPAGSEEIDFSVLLPEQYREGYEVEMYHEYQ